MFYWSTRYSEGFLGMGLRRASMALAGMAPRVNTLQNKAPANGEYSLLS